jgi:hypothetical protein
MDWHLCLERPHRKGDPATIAKDHISNEIVPNYLVETDPVFKGSEVFKEEMMDRHGKLAGRSDEDIDLSQWKDVKDQHVHGPVYATMQYLRAYSKDWGTEKTPSKSAQSQKKDRNS